jgi:methyl-accepting chemotaxis protein
MSFLTNLSIAKKLVAAFAVLVLITTASTTFGYRKLTLIEQANGWSEHTNVVIRTMDRLMLAMVDQETGIRGYLVSADEKFLAPYKKGLEEFAREFAAVKQLTADNPAQQARLDDLQKHARSWQREVAEKEIALMAKPDTREEARRMEAGGAGKTSMDAIRKTVDEVVTVERELLAKRDAEVKAAFSSSYTVSLASLVAMVLIAFGAAGGLFRGIARPISIMTGVMNKLAANDTGIDVPSLDRKDEVGAMARALEVFKQNAIERLQLEEQAKAVQESATAEKRRAMQTLAQEFEAKVGGLVQSLSSAAAEMEATAQTMSATAQQTTNQSTSVASAAEQTSASVQTVAVATEELSSSIREIAEQVTKSSTIANRAAHEAKQTDETVQALAAGAQRIGDVVALISNIAGQTNLLALNATIEAARAGEAGRGFAVVATEVKELASQTARATEEIASQISTIQEETRTAVAAIQTIGATIDEMNSIAAGVAAAMEEQGAATSEIARNVQQAAQGTQVVTGNILDVKSGAGQTGSAAAQVLAAAQELARYSDDLGRQVDSFLAGIKAA